MAEDIGAKLAAAFAARITPSISTDSPVEPVRFPLERKDIAQVWLDGRWEWAVLRPPSKGRPRKLLGGRWIDTCTFVPWGKPVRATGTWASLAIGYREPNTLEDALNALQELSAPRVARGPLELTFPFILRRRRGRRRHWDSVAYGELIDAVDDLYARLQNREAVFRRLAKLKTFGQLSPGTLRRLYYTALSNIAVASSSPSHEPQGIS